MKLQITVQTLEWKKINRGRGRGYGTFRGIEEIASRFSRGKLKTMWNFLGMIKKKLCGISRGLGFRS